VTRSEDIRLLQEKELAELHLTPFERRKLNKAAFRDPIGRKGDVGGPNAANGPAQ
jgi:hypothetical protein